MLTGAFVCVLEGPPESVAHVEFHPKAPVMLSVSSSGDVYVWAKNYTEKWSAFAPDFRELEENEEYVEREDEFDVVPHNPNERLRTDAGGMEGNDGARGLMREASADAEVVVRQRHEEGDSCSEIDILTSDEPEEDEKVLKFLPIPPGSCSFTRMRMHISLKLPARPPCVYVCMCVFTYETGRGETRRRL